MDDAPDEPAWKDMEASAKVMPALIESVGFLIAKHKDRVILAQSVAHDTQTQGRFMIPTTFIKTIQAI